MVDRPDHAAVQPAPSRHRSLRPVDADRRSSPSTSPSSTSATAARWSSSSRSTAPTGRARAERDPQHAVLPVRRLRRARLSRRRRRWRSTSSTSSASRRRRPHTGKWILLIIGVNVAHQLSRSRSTAASAAAFSATTSTTSSAIVTNIVVGGGQRRRSLLAGYGLLHAGRGDDRVRVAAYFLYRRNAYRVFPALRIRPALFRRDRLREVTGFSVYSSIIDWAEQAQLRARRSRHRRLPGQRAGRGLGGGRPHHLRRPSG